METEEYHGIVRKDILFSCELRHDKYLISIATSLLLRYECRLTSSKDSYQFGYKNKIVFGNLSIKNCHND